MARDQKGKNNRWLPLASAIRRGGVIILLLAGLMAGLFEQCAAADLPLSPPSLDSGFHLLYDLNFDRAQQVFASWQQEHPDDPMGSASEAAGLLFSEFNRLGVLESQFFADDHAFAARRKLTPDPAVRTNFDSALNRAEATAQSRLTRDSKDRNALFAMVLIYGLRADYAALVDKHNLESLRFTKQSNLWAQQLLAVDPTCYDAHLATGISQYIIGSMAAPVRWFLKIGGVSGDKQNGIHELQLTAENGRYLAPFARILLAIAYVREKETTHARELLVSLQNDFPENPLFAREIARLDGRN
ncbi:MAG TPA: hypothetical protein VMB18_14110 [Terriglobales bacterium]|nr:hypothetical protein [Terriglobales bacterium]